MLERGCTFDAVSHSYAQNGVIVPSVTRVLDHSGIVSYYMVRQEILEQKSLIGTFVHRATHYYDEGKLDWQSLDDATKGRTEAWANFRSDTGFVPSLIEEPYIATVNGMTYGLMIDRRGMMKKDEAIIELKTSSVAQSFWAIQLAGYALGVPDQNGNGNSPLMRFTSRRRIAVQLFADGKYRKFDYRDPEDANVFLSGLHISHWKLKKGEKLRKIEETP